jgi:hypothetical protein
MKTTIALALMLALAAPAARAHIGDTLPQLREVYGATAKKQGNSMIFQRNGYSICVYFDGLYSAMEIFTRDGSVKGKTDISNNDVAGILTMEGEGLGWNEVTSHSGKPTWLREDKKLIARLSDANDAESGAPGKALVVMINEK